MLLLHLKADKELNILFVLRIFLQIIAVLALLEFHIALAALDDRTCRTCGKWSLQVLGLQGQQVRSSLHSPVQGPRDFPDVSDVKVFLLLIENLSVYICAPLPSLSYPIMLIWLWIVSTPALTSDKSKKTHPPCI